MKTNPKTPTLAEALDLAAGLLRAEASEVAQSNWIDEDHGWSDPCPETAARYLAAVAVLQDLAAVIEGTAKAREAAEVARSNASLAEADSFLWSIANGATRACLARGTRKEKR